jgi:hypothetical protein
MTAQIEDTLLLEGDTYTLVACSGGELVHPRQFLMAPAALHGACTRGYYCAFELDDTHLVLRALTLRCGDDRYLPIAGIEPRIDRRARCASYEDLAVRISYSGRLRVGLGAMQPRGARRPTGYRSVLDVDVVDGRVEQIIDRTDAIHARDRVSHASARTPIGKHTTVVLAEFD